MNVFKQLVKNISLLRPLTNIQPSKNATAKSFIIVKCILKNSNRAPKGKMFLNLCRIHKGKQRRTYTRSSPMHVQGALPPKKKTYRTVHKRCSYNPSLPI